MQVVNKQKKYIEESSFSEDRSTPLQYRSDYSQIPRKKKPVVFQDEDDESSQEFRRTNAPAGIGKRLALSQVPTLASKPSGFTQTSTRVPEDDFDEDDFSGIDHSKIGRLAKQTYATPKPVVQPKVEIISKPESLLPTSKGVPNPPQVIDYTQCKSSVLDLSEFKPSKRFWRVLGDLKPVLMENIHSEQSENLVLIGKIGEESLRQKDDPNKEECAFIRLELSEFASKYWKQHAGSEFVYFVDVPSRQAKLSEKSHQVNVYVEVPSELRLVSEAAFQDAKFLHLDKKRIQQTIFKGMDLNKQTTTLITDQVKDIKRKSPSGKFCYIRHIAELSYYILNCTGCKDTRNIQNRVVKEKFRVLGVVSDLSCEFNLYSDDLEGTRKLQFDDKSGSVEFLLRGADVKFPKSALDREVSFEITLEVDYLLKQSYLLCEDTKFKTSDKDLIQLLKDPSRTV